MNVFLNFIEAGATNTAVTLGTRDFIRCYSIAVLLIIWLSLLLVLVEDVVLNHPHRTEQTHGHHWSQSTVVGDVRIS